LLPLRCAVITVYNRRTRATAIGSIGVTRKITPSPHAVSVRVRVCVCVWRWKKKKKSHSCCAYYTRVLLVLNFDPGHASTHSRRQHVRSHARTHARTQAARPLTHGRARARPDRPGDFTELKPLHSVGRAEFIIITTCTAFVNGGGGGARRQISAERHFSETVISCIIK
jgi:hypothetical protein